MGLLGLARHGDLDGIKQFVREGTPVDIKDQDDKTVLYYA